MLTAGQKIYLPAKRFFDIVFSLLALVVFSPLYILIALLGKLRSIGPVFFKQDRIGEDKKVFKILKFRTMRSDTDPNTPTHMLENPEAHMTKTGKLLRKTSLDEIPQAFNILADHMSIIGPRHALWNQDDLIKARDRYGANSIRPGLSGWAQRNGRDENAIKSKAKLDGEYVRRISHCRTFKSYCCPELMALLAKERRKGQSHVRADIE